jgi:hypothetical protein
MLADLQRDRSDLVHSKGVSMKHDHLGINPLGSVSVIAEQVKRPIARPCIRVRYAELMAELAQTYPGHINFVADAHDLDDRAEHITAVGKAFAEYIMELIDDTAAKLNTGIIDRDAHFQILDTISDLSGQLSRIAQDLAEGSEW